MDLELFKSLGIALGLGLLVGMQRQWAADGEIAGIRTFPMFSLLGAVCAALAEALGGWIVAAGLIAVAALLLVGNAAKLRAGRIDPGLTTEAAALLLYAVGAAVVMGFTAEAVVVGGVVAVLLQWKEPLHGLVRQIGARDIRAVIQLVLIAMVILPVLPNRTFGPFDVLNPFKIWLMVVLISGISIGAYVAYKLLGSRLGTILGGLLGGMISSTATTVSSARQSRETPAAAPLAAVVVLLASTIVWARVLLEIGIVAPRFAPAAAPPIVAMMMFMSAVSLVMFLGVARREVAVPEPENPAQLKTAMIFAALYAGVLVAVAATKDRFGETAMYAVAVVSGLTDLDAITLSTAELVRSERIGADTGWRLILVAALANLVFKAVAVAVLGHRRLLWRVAVAFGLSLAAGAAVLLFWPAGS
jgi:uncharacterized membrane protein (DUF4010 family)